MRGAAAADYSGHISPGHCSQGPSDVNFNNCNADGSIKDGVVKPSCAPFSVPGNPSGKGCGTCYRVTNRGSADPNHPTPGVDRTSTVQIIDACPAYSAENYCKKNVGVDEIGRCGAVGTDALDLDWAAYPDLTGLTYEAGITPNLRVRIEPIRCP